MTNSIIPSANRFFKVNYGRTLFGVGAVLFGTAVWFAASYYTHRADRLGQLVHARLAVSGHLLELEMADRLDKAFLKSFAAVERATRIYGEHLKNAKSLPRLDEVTQEQGRSTTELTRGEVAYAIGVLDGTHFQDERLAKYAAGFKQQLQDYDVHLAIMERFFVAFQAGDERRATQMLQDSDLWGHSDAIAAIVRSRNWGALRLLTLKEIAAQQAEADVAESDIRNSSLLAGLSVGYSVWYAMMVAVYLLPRLRERRRGSSDTVVSPKEAGGPPRPTD